MAEVTREMILDYMIRKGGTVKNVDLVRHFRKYLQLDNPGQKGECGRKRGASVPPLDKQGLFIFPLALLSVSRAKRGKRFAVRALIGQLPL